MTSYNKNDIENKYCGNCHKFHTDMQKAEMDKFIKSSVHDVLQVRSQNGQWRKRS